MNIPAFKYWLRIHRIPLSLFGEGSKSNTIKVNSRKI